MIRPRRLLAALPAAVVFLLVGLAISGRDGSVPQRPRLPNAPPARTAPTRSLTIEWVGDIAFGTSFGLPPGGLRDGLARVRRTLRRADLTMGNLEGTLSVGGASKCAGHESATCISYQAPPAYAGELRALGFDLVNQANNHALDYGASGHEQTLAALASAHVAVAGVPGHVPVMRARGLRVAVLGFAPYSYTNSLLDIPAAAALVRRAARDGNLVVVIIHGGAEGVDADHVPEGSESAFGEDRGDARAFSHAMIDAGAAIVLGSGPHVIRAIERYRGHMIAYSLGDFACWHNLGLGGTLSESAILRVRLSAAGAVLAARWIPVELVGGGLPRPDPARASTRLVEALSVEDFPGHRYPIHSNGVIDAHRSPPARA